MFLNLLLLFTVVPALELYMLIQVGEQIGLWETIGIILLTGVMGAHFAKQQGLQIMVQAQTQMRQGQLPADQLQQGLLVFFGGVLLITPGFFTDLVGLCCVFPWTRKLLLGVLKKKLSHRVRIQTRKDPFSNGESYRVYTWGSGPQPPQPGASGQESMRDVTPAPAKVIDINKYKKEDEQQ